MPINVARMRSNALPTGLKAIVPLRALLTAAYLARAIQVDQIGPQQLAEMTTPAPPRSEARLLSFAINDSGKGPPSIRS